VVLLVASAGAATTRTQTLRFFDKSVAVTLTHADGTVVARAPYPKPKPGDTLDVISVDYAGNHAQHAKKWTASTHLRCQFRSGPPSCESHVAVGDSMLVFAGNPGTVTMGTGIYLGATGRVISNKEVPGLSDASDIVAKVTLHA
jgi:hypothetical protein